MRSANVTFEELVLFIMLFISFRSLSVLQMGMIVVLPSRFFVSTFIVYRETPPPNGHPYGLGRIDSLVAQRTKIGTERPCTRFEISYDLG